MLTIDGYPCLLPDSQGQLDEWQAQFQAMDETAFFCPPANLRSNTNGTRYDNPVNGAGLPVANWPEPPPPRLNTLYWPAVGASRWARGYFAVDQTTASRINSTGKQLRVKISVEESGRNGGVDAYMYLAALRPLSLRDGDKETADVWLAVLADARYDLQFRSAGNLTLTSTTTWDDLFALLKTAAGLSDLKITEAIDSAYLKPDLREFTRNYDNVAAMLDAAAFSVGRRLVFDDYLTTDCELQTADKSNLSLSASYDFHKTLNQVICGGKLKCANGTANIDKFSLKCPKLKYGHPLSDGSVYIAPYGDSGINVVHSSVFADFTGAGSTPDNNTKIAALAAKVNTDWKEWCNEKSYDFTVSRIEQFYFNSSGRTDHVLWSIGAQDQYGHYQCTSRVQSFPDNFWVDRQLSRDPDLVVLNDLEFGQLYDDLTNDSGTLVSILRGDPGSEAALSPDLKIKAYPWPNNGTGAAVKPVVLGKSSRSSDLAAGTKVWLFWHREHNKWYVMPSEWHYGVTDGAIAAATLSGGEYTPGTGTVSLYFYADDGRIKDTGVNVTALNWGLSEIPASDTVFVKQHPQSGRWTAINPNKPFAYGVLTYSDLLSVSNGTQIPFDTVDSNYLLSLDSNGLKLDAGAPSGLYLVLLAVDGQLDDAYSLTAFSDAHFTTDQNTALNTQFQRDYLGAIKFAAFINSLDGIQTSHLHQRTSSGKTAYSDNPYTAIHCHALKSYDPADTIKGYVDIPLTCTLNINQARLTVIYIGN